MSELEQSADSRRRLVVAAVELVLEHFEQCSGLRDVYAYLTPGAVADRAGLSRALIYHHWGNVESNDRPAAFASFLEAVSDEIWSLSADPEDLTELARLLPDNQSDLIRVLTAFELHRVTHSEGPLWRASEVMVLHGVQPAGDADEVIARLAGLYHVVLDKLDREPVPPLVAEDLALAVSCVFGGFATQAFATPHRSWVTYDWTPQVEPEASEPDWTLLAITVESMVVHMTRPRS